ncbi:hypothetical protein B0H14DRAFT_3455480 [Mycena olivaceomarginata]|nr:hypothetical protein B0H14DRAFT_3455480 [Mycena olivaceomarginata]
MASLTSIVAEFRGAIVTSIPQIVDLLKDTHSTPSFRGSIVTSIPQIVDLLKDTHSTVRREGANALSKLSEQGM